MHSMPRNIALAIPFVLLVLMAALAWATRDSSLDGQSDQVAAATFLTPTVGPTGHFSSVQVSEDGTRHLIPLDAIRSGGPPKDGIPSIDAPRFVGSESWNELGFSGDNLVIGVEVNGIRRAYPFQVLVWHEIVNDVIDGKPLLITYCPLCGTGIAFEREIEGEPVQFGVSGQLYNSDLLMYDRKTDSFWSQITGTAVVGPLAGTVLPFYPSEIMTWDDWRQTYPDSAVLSPDTGFSRDYSVDPYSGYYADGNLWFPVSGLDARLPVKERVTGIEVEGAAFGAYPDEAVVEHGPVNDQVGDTPVLVVADPTTGNTIRVFERRVGNQTLEFSMSDGGTFLLDGATQSQWSFNGQATDGELAGNQLTEILPVKGFWFAWFAFHQDTELWLPE
jgi:hypothetical protein